MKKDKVYLEHILDAIGDIKRFTEGVPKEEFLKNKEKQYAVLRALEIIGEATKNLSAEMKADCPEVRWSDVAGMRDKLIHAYFGVNLNLVWETIDRDVPELGKAVSKLLKSAS